GDKTAPAPADAPANAPEPPAKGPAAQVAAVVDVAVTVQPGVGIGLWARLAPIPAVLLSPLAIRLAALSKPIQHTLGWIALGTLFNAGAIWVAVFTQGAPAAEGEGPGAVTLVGGEAEKAAAAHEKESAAKEAHGAKK